MPWIDSVNELLISELEMVGMSGDNTESSAVSTLDVMKREIDPLILFEKEERVDLIVENTESSLAGVPARESWFLVVSRIRSEEKFLVSSFETEWPEVMA